MGANIQGSGRSKERTESKWDKTQSSAVSTGATLMLMQEIWGGKRKQRDRGLADFWGESSQHQKSFMTQRRKKLFEGSRSKG